MDSTPSLAANPRISGSCLVCGEQLFEVLQTYPRDHPFAGEPMRLGKLTALDAVRSYAVLADGTQAPMTTCGECADVLDGNLPAVWATCWVTHVRQRTHWWLYGAQPFNAKQTKKAYVDSAKLYDNVPLGVLFREPLIEAMSDETSA